MTTISIEEFRSGKLKARLPGQKVSQKPGKPEEILHRAIVQWADAKVNRIPELKYLFHSPNGGGRSKAEAGALKACGVKKGVPDLLLPLKSPFFSGLAVELKAGKNTTSSEQRDWLTRLELTGYVVGVARSIEDFEFLVQAYLGKTHYQHHPGYTEIHPPLQSI